jgi:hypothetical protein
MIRVDLETETGLGRLRQATEYVTRGFYGSPALLADQMAVGPSSQVVGGRAVRQVGVQHDSQSFEFVKIAVDGREVDVGSLGVDLGG